ncbi:hypothetical protein [Nitrospirillum iridis]|uniref:Uncharacterized protein n=1 Tax=Nitrospirillum iridis TaxID=765888 RepID=A0A7X0AUM4_9PROT|nr:hypothetical protein [Nitrospirillum iridis]MBB6250414.1 hypothetical protein [Nitrospirillum iridis]
MVALMGLVSVANAASRSLQYEPAVVELTGTVVVEDHYGPPNFGETPQEDAKLRVPMLRLDASVDVAGDPHSDTNLSSFEDVDKMQIVLTKGRSVDGFIGKHVTVTGTLTEQLEGGDFTQVLITMKTIKPAR